VAFQKTAGKNQQRLFRSPNADHSDPDMLTMANMEGKQKKDTIIGMTVSSNSPQDGLISER
jgi:hypothetical protein